MSQYDFRTPRLLVEAPLQAGAEVALDRDRANYLFNVLRLKAGDAVLLFNGRDGEWQSTVAGAGKRGGTLTIGSQARAQPPSGDVHLVFAPLKHARLDYLVQKAVEMGAGRIQPVITRHTQVARVNLERMRANVVEAAQQCGVLSLAEVGEPLAFARMLEQLSPRRLVVFCDEDADVADPGAALRAAPPHDGVTLVIGPEGGFSDEERAALAERDNVVRLSLGPRILRADTAAVAALALVQTVLGDWK
ncbi:MAG TPA: 16S rRNA (uracil(1498)-N(3))-methyltransferase [Pseudolabrys sp.]|jgi:16S rRNA (uracil1498-N3)-methyltransferase|nr:16S rRNA (uracil(1498)-N(3))-methyltransferase [Pseudolabrys sp.]